MLPAPQSANPSSPSTTPSASTSTPLQYGLHQHGHGDDLDGVFDREDGRSPESSRSGSDGGHPQRRRGSASDGKRRLSFNKTSSNGYKSNEWKGKGVIVRSKGNGNCYILKAPNEVLTHVLSYLDPSSLNSASIINRRFYNLMTSPHAWRIAFSRYFPQHQHALSPREHIASAYPPSARYFTRLTLTSTHRSEYLLRTQLLRSLKRGRPHFGVAFKQNSSHSSSNFSMVTYSPKLYESTITHIAADFGRHKVVASSIYTGLYSISDPRNGYVEVEQRLHPGYTPQGLLYTLQHGISCLDVSELHGQIIGDARVGGNSFFAMRTNGAKAPQGFLEGFNDPTAIVTAVWLAKKETVVNTSGNTVLSATGWSKGVVEFQGTGKGVVSCIVCPGIPILEIKVDDGYTKTRERWERIWCVVVNALGEVYYLKGRMPGKFVGNKALGYEIGLRWHCVPGTKVERSPVGIDALSLEDIKPTEQQLLEALDAPAEMLEFKYVEHWGGDHFIEVDFGGQNIITGRNGVVETRHGRGHLPSLRKYGRISILSSEAVSQGDFVTAVYGKKKVYAVFEEPTTPTTPIDTTPDDWTTIEFKIPKLAGKGTILITARAIDMSHVALLSKEEEQLTPSQFGTNLPGQFSRLFAIGTSTGTVHVFNARQPPSETPFSPLRTIETESPEISTLALTSLYLVHGGTDGLVQAWDPLGSTLEPIRAIHSRFSMKARRRLAQAAASVQGVGENQYAAHALVLDPDPTQLRGVVALGTHIRSWSFASSSEVLDTNSNSRRRKLEGRRGSNSGGGGSGQGTPGKFRHTSKVVLRSDIAEEKKHLKGEERKQKAEEEFLLSRFGAGQGGLSEEEQLAYAQMLSEEAFERELGPHVDRDEHGEIELMSESPEMGSTSSTSGWPEHNLHGQLQWNTPPQSTSHSPPDEMVLADVEHDLELAKALQESLLGEDAYSSPDPYSPGPANNGSGSIPIKYVKSKKLRPLARQNTSPRASGSGDAWGWYNASSGSPSARKGSVSSGVKDESELEKEIELAIQLSLEEEELRKALELSQLDDNGSSNKGKERA